MRLMVAALLLASLLVALGCTQTARRESPGVETLIDIGDSGTGHTVADRVYKVLNSSDGSWVSISKSYDPVAQLDTSVRGDAAQLSGDMSTFDAVVGSTQREGDVLTQRWKFSDKSELAYRSEIDQAGQRSRYLSVRVTRP